MKKKIKKNLSTVIVIIVAVLVLLGIIFIKNTFFAGESKAIYGNRLEGRKNVEISKETKNKVKKKLEGSADSVSVRVAGRIIYINVDAKDEVTLEAAKNLGPAVLEEFSDNEKAYYDIQILIENMANRKQFPIIGYKHHTKANFSWTKDRTE
ncbi:MAG: hypothetical protein IJI22_01795 [Bacilli bacterium]|nr:hypothetical protein [Bacilli bacterium]